MMRALYTAATGMRAEQTNVDTIANNLSKHSKKFLQIDYPSSESRSSFFDSSFTSRSSPISEAYSRAL